MAEEPAEKKPSRWRGRTGWILLAFGAAERLLGWGGSIDFLVSRSKDPGWLRTVLTFAAGQASYLGFLFIMAGVALIVWNERRRTAQLLEARIPLGPTVAAMDAEPAVRRLNAVVRIEDLEKFQTWFRQHAGALDTNIGFIGLFFSSYAKRVEDYLSKGEPSVVYVDSSGAPIIKIQNFIREWEKEVSLVVAKTVEILGERYNLVYDQPRLDLPLDHEPEGLDLSALLSFRSFRSRSANFRTWRENVRRAIRAEIEHMNAVRRGEA